MRSDTHTVPAPRGLWIGRWAVETQRPRLGVGLSVPVGKLWVSRHEIRMKSRRALPGGQHIISNLAYAASRAPVYILHARGHWVDASRDTATRSAAATRSLPSLVKTCLCLSDLAMPLAHIAKALSHTHAYTRAYTRACMCFVTWNSAVVVCGEASLLLHRARMTRFSSSGTSSEWKLAHVSFAPAGSPLLVRPMSSSCAPAYIYIYVCMYIYMCVCV